MPRVPHRRFAGKSGLGPRGDAILQLDWCVGELLALLDKHALRDKTLVIFTSDNGPVVDDGYQDEAKEKLGDHKPAGPLRGGKYSIFEGGTRVPFIVRWPGRVKPGVSDALVCQVDFPATFAALAGRPFDATTSPDSQNLLPALLGDSTQGREELVEHAGGGIALRHGAWKFIEERPGPKRDPQTDIELGNDPNVQLYDLRSDLAETKNIAAQHPEMVKEFRAALEKERAKGMPWQK